jgi:putative FmdB family regulatory protein
VPEREDEGEPVPTYQYACTECSHSFDQFQSFSDDALTECPECHGRLRKVFNAVGVVFKGSGFYRTDSRASNGSSDGSPSESAAGKSDGKGDSTGDVKADNKPEKKSADKSPAPKGESGSKTPAPAAS